MRRKLLIFTILPALLVISGSWLLLSHSTYAADLKISSIKSTSEKEHISWHNFHDFVREIDLQNSTALFNSVYAALRQSASDIHPVGVTYFPAIVPKGTLLFHAGSGQMPEGLEWLAMDSEFSFNFGSRRRSYGRRSTQHRGPGGPGGGPGGGPHKMPKEDGKHPNPPPNRNEGGSKTMMTFRATRDLNRLLYLDGASAAKTSTGEMDTQKMISDLVQPKSNSTDDPDDGKHGMVERLYAERICNWGKAFGLDGFIRVEVGFELVLCDFLDGSVELVSNISYPMVSDVLELPPPTVISSENGWPLDDEGSIIEDDLTEEQLQILDKEDKWEDLIRRFDTMVSFDQIRAGFVHDKGDRRIQLDYRYLVTGINRTFLNPDPNNRRLLTENTTLEMQSKILRDLEQGLKKGFDSSESTDWQQVFDEVVDKFSPTLNAMSSLLGSEGYSAEEVAMNVTRYTGAFTRKFIDKVSPADSTSTTQRDLAVYQYIRPLKSLNTESDYLVWSSAVRVVAEVVDTLFDIHEWLWPVVLSTIQEDSLKDTDQRLLNSYLRLSQLLKALNWITLNYECERLCDNDEVCYTPSWGPSPLGWAIPDSTESSFGMHYDADKKRQVIDDQLKCINADFISRDR